MYCAAKKNMRKKKQRYRFRPLGLSDGAGLVATAAMLATFWAHFQGDDGGLFSHVTPCQCQQAQQDGPSTWKACHATLQRQQQPGCRLQLADDGLVWPAALEHPGLCIEQACTLSTCYVKLLQQLHQPEQQHTKAL